MNIQQLYEYCLSKKGVTEHFPFDEDTLVFKVGGKKVIKSEMGARLGDFVSTSMIGQYGDCPIYLTVWQVSYTIKGKPEGDVETNIETNGKPNSR